MLHNQYVVDDDVDIIMDITGTATEMKPIANSIYRKWENGGLRWAGFCNRPKFNMERQYNLFLINTKDGVVLYTSPIE